MIATTRGIRAGARVATASPIGYIVAVSAAPTTPSLQLPNPATFPKTHAYISALPGGWGAHAHATVKATMYREALNALDQPLTADEVPEALREYITSPLPVSAMIPEAHNIALYLVIRDLRFVTDRQWLAWMREIFRAFYDRPAYRILFRAVTPLGLLTTARLKRATGLRWKRFRQGTSFGRAQGGDEELSEIRYPENLFNPLAIDAFAAGIEVGFQVAGQKHVRVTTETVGEKAATLRIHDAR